MKNLISNYHTHTFRCGHAAICSDEEYVKKAIEHGYKNIGFSDHAPFKGVHHPDMRMDFGEDFFDYINSINFLKEKYKDKINIYLGLEIEYMESKDNYYKELLNDYKLDYLILGQHCVYDEDNEPHFYYHGLDDLEGVKNYVNDLIKGINSGYFLYVCHPDIFLNHIRYINKDIDGEIDKICLAAKNKNIPLEININGENHNKFSALRYGCFHYPSPYFFEKASKIGNKFIFGVDAHNPINFDEVDLTFLNRFIEEAHIKEKDIIKEIVIKK